MSLPILQATPELGPLEQALSSLWQTKRHQFYTLGNVVSLLRLRRRFDLGFASLDGLKVMIPHGQVPDCEACTDVCCTGKNAIVTLRLRDIAALLDANRADLIVTADAPKKGDSGDVFRRVFPTLRRDATGTCAALTDDRLCGLHPGWPLSCARYPYAYDRKNHVVFYAKGCRSHTTADVSEAPIAVRRLVRAALEAYNARVRDVFLLTFAKDAVRELGLSAFLREDAL